MSFLNRPNTISNAWDWSYTLTDEPALFANRGFTGHEFLPEFNLYNMNGRLYDPVVGRFLNPDNFIQDPANTQSYNRYSYCLNNPLKYTDPSGNKWNWPKFDWFYAIPGIGQLGYIMQTINDNTTGLRKKMSEAGIPDFGVTVNRNYAGDVNYNYSINGHEIYNSYSAKTDILAQGLDVGFNEWQNAIAQNYIARLGGGGGGSWGDESFFGDEGFGIKAIEWIIAGGPAIEGPYYGGIVPTPLLRGMTPEQMFKLGKRLQTGWNQAPKSVKRVDIRIKTDPIGRPLHNQNPHIHLKDGRALNLDGTWKHGTGEIPNDVNNWIIDAINFLFY